MSGARKQRRIKGAVAGGYTSPVATIHQLTAILLREGDGYVSLCPEVDVASQGATVEEARANLIEALELFFETADPTEIQERLPKEVFVTASRSALGRLRRLSGGEVCRILEKHGRQGPPAWQHLVMQRRAGKTTVTVPIPCTPS
jgi:predicted RNase H-like HicB family nuclease